MMSDQDELEARRARQPKRQVVGVWSLHDEPAVRDVPCRRCGAPVPIKQWVLDMAKRFSEYLATKGEPPLQDGELTMCEPCGKEWNERKIAAAQEVGERVSNLIRSVKAGVKTADSTDFAWLRRNGYGDTADGLEALQSRRRDEEEERGRRKGGV